MSTIYTRCPDIRSGSYDDNVVLPEGAMPAIRWRYRMLRKDGMSAFYARYVLLDAVKIGIMWGGERNTANYSFIATSVTRLHKGGE